MLENIQSLRRHYPDQVRGYDLSRLSNGTPLFFGGKNRDFFGTERKMWIKQFNSKKECNFAA